MADMGNSGVAEGSDTEDLLVTSVNGHQHLENFVGASLFIRGDRDFGAQGKVGYGDDGLRSNVGFPYQCYSSPEGRDCFDDGYPLLIHTKRGLEGIGSYQEPFVTGSCFYARPAVGGGGISEFEQGIGEFDHGKVSPGKDCEVFEFEECSKINAREENVCGSMSDGKCESFEEFPHAEDGVLDVVSAEKCGASDEWPNERGEVFTVGDAMSAEKCQLSEECLDEKGGEYNECDTTSGGKFGRTFEFEDYHVGNEGSLRNVEVRRECTKEFGREIEKDFLDEGKKECADEFGLEIRKECSDEKAKEGIACNEASAEKNESLKECSNYEVASAGSEADVEIQKGYIDGVGGERLPCNSNGILAALVEAGKNYGTIGEGRKQIYCGGGGERGADTLETERQASMHEEVGNSEQQAPSGTCAKQIGRKSTRRKKPTSLSRRAPRKSSEKAEDFVPSIGGGVDLLNLNNAERPDASQIPQIDVADRPVCSSSVAPSTGQASNSINGTNEVDLKLQAASETNDNGAILSSNKKIDDKIVGRITRSRAYGKSHKKTVVNDSLSDDGNAIFAHKMTGKRSVLSKTVRSTVWGVLENLREGVKKTGRTLNSELSFPDIEFGEGNIESAALQNKQLHKRGRGVKRQKPGQILEHRQSELAKSPVFGSSITCTEKKDDSLERDCLQVQGVLAELGGSKEQISDVERDELVCFKEDHRSGGSILLQGSIEQEHKYLETQSVRSPNDRSKCYLPHEVLKPATRAEEENRAHDLGETGKTIIGAEVTQNCRGRRRGSGVKKQQSGRIGNNEQSRHVKFPAYGISGNCKNKDDDKDDDKQGKGLLEDPSFVRESRISDDCILNFQEREFHCLSRDLPSDGVIARQNNTEEEQKCLGTERMEHPTDPSNCLPLEVPNSSGRIEEKNTVQVHSIELCKASIQYGVLKNQERRERGNDVKRQQPGKNLNNGQSDQVKLSVFGSRRKKNDRQGKAVLSDKGSVVGTGGSEEHESTLQGSQLLCCNGDLYSEGAIVRQKSLSEGRGCQETARDQCPMEQPKYHLPLEFQMSPPKVEEKSVTHGRSTEQMVSTFMNETESHVSSTIKTEAYQQGSSENKDHVFDVLHEKENNVSRKEQAAITVHDLCGISVDNSINPLEECRNNTYAAVSSGLKIEKNSGSLGLGRTNAQDVPVSLRELLDAKDESLEPNFMISKFEKQDGTRAFHTETVTTDTHLKGFAGSGLSMEVIDPCRMECRNAELHDTVSATSHDNTVERVARKELGTKKRKDKKKLTGESKLSEAGVGLAEATLGIINICQDQNAVKKMTKNRCKKTGVRIHVQGRKSNLKNKRNISYAAGNDQVVVNEGMLFREVEGNVSFELQETFNNKETRKEEPIKNLKLENTLSFGKSHGRKFFKKVSGGNREAESMGGTLTHEKKRKVTRQINNTSDKKLSRGKSKQVQNGLSSSRNNAKPGLGLSIWSSKDDPSNHEKTGQGMAISADLSGIKGQSDSCTDVASPLKIVNTSASGQKKKEEKHGFSSLFQGSVETNVLKNKILERRGMAGCNNEAAVEDVLSVFNEEEANRVVNMIKFDQNLDRDCGLPRVGWVSCDDCQKWRRVPVELVDSIGETNCKWTCKDNPNKEFAACSIPQEKSNAEINAELNISDVSCEEGDFNGALMISKNRAATQIQDAHQGSWTGIKRNMFLYRTRKTQAIDEIMVCHCKPSDDGSFGCGDECLNRMLNIECVKGTCPCGDLCSNQRFQKRIYAKVGLLRCGKKGFGLQVLQEIPEGLFIIEYVGEVLDMQAYDARQKEYALRGQKHFYFMTLSSNEVIDACVKGNLGRFINHSCDPNCQTQKWMVNGEVCIGLFAVRDIKKGEELTFDYNYERVFGAVAKKCECSSAECRGFIGGDQSTPAIVVPTEPDDDFPVPVMLHDESDDSGEENNVAAPNVHSLGGNDSQEEHPFQLADKRSQCSLAQQEKQAEVSSNYGTNESTSGGAIGNTLNLKSPTIQTNIGHFEGVEEKLNELLDSEGGISKRKDSAKHYLKLLLLTAASGDTSNGEASHSTRDLSMILDAVLKTRSRTVLVDIMNKNGLQMLQNLIKQNCGSYDKTPIMRKLLKVLEFLATKDVLTIEHIISDPPCGGRESLKDSICALTTHNDWQVQKIARSFRDSWNLHPIKTFKSRERSLSNEPGLTLSDHSNSRFKFSVKRQKNLIRRDTDAIDCTSQIPREQENVTQSTITWSEQHESSYGPHDNVPAKDSNMKLSGDHSFEGQMKGAGIRKRKSRWDQPTEPITCQSSAKMSLENEETKIKHGKECGSLILPSETENIPGTRQDVLTIGCKWSSAEKKPVIQADKNICRQDTAVQFAQSSNPLSEEMSMLNESGAIVKDQSSFQSTTLQIAQLPGRGHSFMGSIHTSSCSKDRPCAQPYMMGYPQGKTVLGYAIGKLHVGTLPHLPLSYGIPLSLLEQLGRPPCSEVDSVAQQLSPVQLHCEPNSSSVAATMLQNMSCRPFLGQHMVGGFVRNPHNQLRPSNIQLKMQSPYPLQNGKQQPLEMPPRGPLWQPISANSNYVDPEPPVPGLSPKGSLENMHNSNRPVRGRNKTGYDQTLKPWKRHWKNQKSNSRMFSKVNGYSERKYKDGFHPRKSFSLKSAWKGRIFSNFHNFQNVQNLPNGNILDFEKEQKLEKANNANLPKGVIKTFPTFH